MTTETPFQFQQ